MNQGVYPLAANMVNQLNRVDVLANNLANSSTNGFKQDSLAEGSFNNYLKKAQEKDQPISRESEVTNIIPKIDTKYISEEMGAITPTNNKLDFAIKQSDMFFKIQDPKTKNIVLTRDGTFNNLNGKLVTQNGFEVLNNDNLPINIPQDNFEQQISLVKTDYTNLKKQGNNQYLIKDNTKVEKIVTNDDFLVQGAVERSNVNSVLTMVNLIEAQRGFEQSQKAITSIDSINEKAISKIGDNR
jgi:flagellar basal-body rod protein FlgG